jgi:putative spermidine/putrescine transport system ATP-binding protein
VEALSGGLATATGHGGLRIVIPIGRSQVAKGSVVFASTRRDRIALAKLPAGAGAPLDANTVAGKVHAIEYQGSHVKVTIDLETPEEFVANVSDEAFFREPLEIGDRVLARWSADDVRILDTPEFKG